MGEGLESGLIYHSLIYLLIIYHVFTNLFICFQGSDCSINVYHNRSLVDYVFIRRCKLGFGL